MKKQGIAVKKRRLPGASPQGFTLTEIMVSLSVIAVVAALGGPSLFSARANATLKAAARDLFGTLQLARRTAIATNRPVRVRFKTSSYFIDLNNDGTYTPSATDTYTDLNGDGAYNRGEPYIDLDGDGAYTGEISVNFNDYGHGVKPGTGNAAANWSGAPCVQRSFITFNSRGTSNSGTIYLANRNNDICYAVTVRSSGSQVIRRYSGAVPFNKKYWR